jgi:hypothetical protein
MATVRSSFVFAIELKWHFGMLVADSRGEDFKVKDFDSVVGEEDKQRQQQISPLRCSQVRAQLRSK